MNLTVLTKTDLTLAILARDMNTLGKDARREITRRKLVGFSDGTNIQKIDAKAEMEDESRVGEITIVS